MITYRNYQSGDTPHIVALYSAAEAVDKSERNFSADELTLILTSSLLKPETDVFLAYDGETLAGVNILETWLSTPDANKVNIMGVIHPEYRQRRIGATLMQLAEVRAGEIFRALPTPKPEHQLDVWTRDHQQANIKLFERLGFKPVRYFCSMQRRLDEPLPQPGVLDGLTIRTYLPQDNGPLLAAFNEAFRDHWGSGDMPADVWEHELLGVPYFRPDLWFLALEGEEIAGFTLCGIDPAYTERIGRKEGHVMEVGVRRPWRKRGVASTLIALGLQAIKQAGMETALLGVDVDSPTGAFSLYERLGFKELRRSVVYRKLLN